MTDSNVTSIGTHGKHNPNAQLNVRQDELTVEKMRTRVQDIDAISQEICGEIAGLVGVAIAGLKSPAPASAEDMIAMLRLIAARATNLMDSINADAEGMGCNYREERL